jgi:CDP-diacylglycerol---glycerol-3-phosphate 3-phosphatidyltransferase
LHERYLHSPWNEIISLQHSKIYVFDNNILLSGANLSESYFTNRVDRYILFRDLPGLANYYMKFVFALSAFPDMNLMLDFLSNYVPESGRSLEITDTYVIPTVQLPFLKINQDCVLTEQILKLSLENRFSMLLCTAYFNLADNYEVLLEKFLESSIPLELIVASPKSNSFYGSKGLKKYIPAIYESLLYQFYKRLDTQTMNTQKLLQIREFERVGWTFHAKGIWCFDHTELPFLASIGSSNYGSRSIYRDVEAQATLLTRNIELQQKLNQSINSNFLAYTSPANLNSSRNYFIRKIANSIKSFL